MQLINYLLLIGYSHRHLVKLGNRHEKPHQKGYCPHKQWFKKKDHNRKMQSND